MTINLATRSFAALCSSAQAEDLGSVSLLILTPGLGLGEPQSRPQPLAPGWKLLGRSDGAVCSFPAQPPCNSWPGCV